MDRNRRDSLLRSSIIGGFRAIEREKWIDRKMERERGNFGVERRRESCRIGEEVSDDGFVAAANGSLPARFRFQFPLLIAAGQLPDPQRDKASKGESNSFRDSSLNFV